MIKLTKAQDSAINKDGFNALISAGAGCGKTFVLTERILRLIKQGDSITDFAVLTFTNMAAAEMKDRIAKKLEEEGLLEQVDLVSLASIMTIHGFCGEIIRENFEILNLPPKMIIMDDMMRLTLKEQAMELALEELYGQPDFAAFAQKVSATTDEELREMIERLVDFAANKPNGLDDVFELIDSDENILPVILNYITAQLNFVLARYADFEPELFDGFEPAKQQRMDEELQVRKIIDLINIQQPELAIEFLKFDRIKKMPEDFKAEYMLMRNEAKKILEKCGELIKNLLDIDTADKEDCLLLIRAGAEFSAQYQQLKLNSSLMDYNDLEHYAYEILKDEDVCSYYRKRFKHILVDEYQDTSEIQEAIISRVKSGDNLFMVGDIKQSIYGFRSADPSIFLDKYSTFGVSGLNRKIELNVNFRSSSNILNFVNGVFSRLLNMQNQLYPKEAFLQAGSEITDSPIQIRLLLDDKTRPEHISADEMEAAYVAKLIQQQKKKGASYSDMAILVRNNTHLMPYQKVLNAFGIPAALHLDESKGGAIDVDVNVFICLMQLIDNSKNDIPLVSVLYSNFFNLDLDELIEIKLEGKKYFYENVSSYVDNHNNQLARKLIDLYELIEDLKAASRQLNIEQLIALILEKTKYIDFLSSLPFADDKINAIHLLMQLSSTFEQQSKKGLGAFLELIEQQSFATLAVPTNVEAVQVMTMHKSKGLEYPIVFLSRLKYPLLHAERDNIVSHNKLGFGLFHYERQFGLKSPTVRYTAITLQQRLDSLEEEMRLLYVAMTRAKEKLYLIGVSDNSKDYQRPINSFDLLSGKGMIEHILHVLDYDKPQADYQLQLIAMENIDLPVKQKAKAKLTPEKSAKLTALLQRLPPSVIKPVITKTSVSSIAKQQMDTEGRVLYDPSKASSFSRSDAALRGSVTHQALFLRKNKENVQQLMKRLHENKFFTDQELELLDLDMIQRFIDSKLCERMEKSEKVFKEKPFVLVVNSGEFGMEEDTLVQGVIDLMFWEDDGWVLVDYKSDSINKDFQAQVKHRYEKQLDIYCKAIENLTQEKVSERVIFLLNKGMEVRV